VATRRTSRRVRRTRASEPSAKAATDPQPTGRLTPPLAEASPSDSITVVNDGDAPAESQPHTAGAKTPQVLVVLIGDEFQEEFHTPILLSKDDSDAPFTHPEAMRGKSGVQTSTVNSGTRLHAEVLNRSLELLCKALEPASYSGEPKESWFTIFPPQDTTTNEPASRSAPQTFNTYLHELSAFPQTLKRQGSREKVWRVAATRGLVQDDRIDKPADRKEKSLKYYREQLKQSKEKIETHIEENRQNQVLLVINDRDQGLRECERELNDLIMALPKPNDGTSQFLILWQVRSPFKKTSSIMKLLKERDVFHSTAVVVNHQCLRDSGINIRFDMSYEHTVKDLLDFANDHQKMQLLLHARQLLIRFDYGVLHLINNKQKIEEVDIHALNGGPYYSSPHDHGMVTGRTFFLASAIILECLRWYRWANNTGKGGRGRKTPGTMLPTNISGFLYETVETSSGDKDEEGFVLKRDRSTSSSPYSILRNSIVDRAIDLGILFFVNRFYEGYGDFSRRSLPDGVKNDKIAEHLTRTMTEFLTRLSVRAPFPTDSSSKIDGDYKLLCNHVEPKLTQLVRLSTPPELLRNDHGVSEKREVFSRVDVLGVSPIVSLVPASEQNTKFATGSKSRDTGFDERVFREHLYLIVQDGIESVLGSRRKDDLFVEPSIIIPYVSFDDSLMVVDRDDIDGLLSVRGFIESYLRRARPGLRPLCLGVFGPPGSGKGFYIKQILRTVGKDPKSSTLTFNLSQFSSLGELSRAFKRIQDRAMSGDVPVAFFDEFDAKMGTEDLGWLKFFLAPMQDGEFFDGTDVFHVGPSIFVFGGGTADTFQKFNEKYGSRVMEKVPDFISRLRGHLNVADISVASPCDGDDESPVDHRLMVRRALLLRGLLKNAAPEIFEDPAEHANIDRNVVYAFLLVKKFEHGARSMEAIISMSKVGESASLQRSSLPTLAQLNMHVDGREFLDIVNHPWDED
jgi:hypothetical protein